MSFVLGLLLVARETVVVYHRETMACRRDHHREAIGKHWETSSGANTSTSAAVTIVFDKPCNAMFSRQ